MNDTPDGATAFFPIPIRDKMLFCGVNCLTWLGYCYAFFATYPLPSTISHTSSPNTVTIARVKQTHGDKRPLRSFVMAQMSNEHDGRTKETKGCKRREHEQPENVPMETHVIPSQGHRKPGMLRGVKAEQPTGGNAQNQQPREEKHRLRKTRFQIEPR